MFLGARNGLLLNLGDPYLCVACIMLHLFFSDLFSNFTVLTKGFYKEKKSLFKFKTSWELWF